MLLSREQLKALSMFAEGMTSGEIAKELKVSSRSIQRWQKLPEFAKGLANINSKATSNTIEATAAAGVHMRTVQRWLREPEVKAKLMELQQQTDAITKPNYPYPIDAHNTTNPRRL